MQIKVSLWVIIGTCITVLLGAGSLYTKIDFMQQDLIVAKQDIKDHEKRIIKLESK